MNPQSLNGSNPTNNSATAESNRTLILWLSFGCVLIFLMVIIGGITRLTHSGLSITEWNLLMGTLPPLNDQQWQQLFEKYQQTPEFKQVHYLFTLSDFKSIFWWEYFHRLTGRLLGIVFIIPFIYFLKKKKISRHLLPKLIIIFLLGALQGFLGWYMVKSGLVNKPAVSHLRLAAHLITAFATFGYIYWVILDLTPHLAFKSEEKSISILRKFIYTLMVLVFIQTAYGALVAGLKAGVLYPTYPRMGGEWIAEEIKIKFSEQGWRTFFSDGASVQFVHRWLGTLILFLSIGIWLFSRQVRFPSEIIIPIRILIFVIMAQFLLGYFTLIKSVPLFYAIMHQAGAFLLLGTVLFLMHRLKTIQNLY